jgi:hypothetical protein
MQDAFIRSRAKWISEGENHQYINAPFKEVDMYCFAFVCRSVRRSVDQVITKERLGLGTSNLD